MLLIIYLTIGEMKLQTQISAIGPEAGQGVRDLLSGAGTDAAGRISAPPFYSIPPSIERAGRASEQGGDQVSALFGK